jgi:hypothetical protein
MAEEIRALVVKQTQYANVVVSYRNRKNRKLKLLLMQLLSKTRRWQWEADAKPS